MSASLQTSSIDDLLSLEIETERTKLVILPELGAKVISLLDKAGGREHLWRHPGRPFRRPHYGASFEQYDLSGWDECFPTIGEVVYSQAPWQGITVPDHGELWSLPWQWDFADNSLRMWVNSVRFAYRFERTFHFSESGAIAIAYAVHNPTEFPLHALWSMHPFMNVTASSRVILPPEVRVRVELSLDERVGAFLSEHPWPLTQNRRGQSVDLSRVEPIDAPVIEKLFTTPLVDGYAALIDESDGAFLAFTFDPQQVPFVGVCHIRNGWADVGAPSNSTILEPCSGWPDRLDLAMTRGAAMVIPPRDERRWQVNLHVGTGQVALERVIGHRVT